METKTVKNVFEVALSEEQDKLSGWTTISIVNGLLAKARINAIFSLSQQNRYNHNSSGEGTLITLIADDCERKEVD